MKNDSMPRGSGSLLDENIFGVGGGGEEEARGAGVMQLFLGKMTFSQHAVWRRTGQARPICGRQLVIPTIVYCTVLYRVLNF